MDTKEMLLASVIVLGDHLCLDRSELMRQLICMYHMCDDRTAADRRMVGALGNLLQIWLHINYEPNGCNFLSISMSCFFACSKTIIFECCHACASHGFPE